MSAPVEVWTFDVSGAPTRVFSGGGSDARAASAKVRGPCLLAQGGVTLSHRDATQRQRVTLQAAIALAAPAEPAPADAEEAGAPESEPSPLTCAAKGCARPVPGTRGHSHTDVADFCARHRNAVIGRVAGGTATRAEAIAQYRERGAMPPEERTRAATAARRGKTAKRAAPKPAVTVRVPAQAAGAVDLPAVFAEAREALTLARRVGGVAALRQLVEGVEQLGGAL